MSVDITSKQLAPALMLIDNEAYAVIKAEPDYTGRLLETYKESLADKLSQTSGKFRERTFMLAGAFTVICIAVLIAKSLIDGNPLEPKYFDLLGLFAASALAVILTFIAAGFLASVFSERRALKFFIHKRSWFETMLNQGYIAGPLEGSNLTIVKNIDKSRSEIKRYHDLLGTKHDKSEEIYRRVMVAAQKAMMNPQDVMESRNQFDLALAELQEQEVALFSQYMNYSMNH